MDGDITRYAYDAAGRRIETSLSSLITSYSYDSVGNLLEQVTSGASEIAFSYSYNKNGYITGEVRKENGTTTTTTSTYAYDALGQLTSFLQSTGYGEQYAYDKAGNMTEKVLTGTDGIETALKMSYNKANQLTGMANGKDKITYKYDKNGSMVEKALSSKTYGKLTDSYAYNALDQLTEYVGYDGYQQAFVYDANGMRLSKSEAGNGNRSTLEELLRGNIAGLPEIVEPAQGQTNADEADMPTELEWATTEYLYDLTQEYYQVISETSTSKNGSTTTAYAYGLERIAAYTASSKTSYVYDGRGSVAQAVTAPIAGEAVSSALPDIGVQVQSFSYTAFGEQMGTRKVSGYAYNAEAYDAATGMLNLRARLYEPAMNRFSQKDIIRGQATSPLSLNRYAYCVNNPVMHTDPSGESVLDSIGTWWNKAKQTALGQFVDTFVVQPIVKMAQKIANVVATVAKTAIKSAAEKAAKEYNTEAFQLFSSILQKIDGDGVYYSEKFKAVVDNMQSELRSLDPSDVNYKKKAQEIVAKYCDYFNNYEAQKNNALDAYDSLTARMKDTQKNKATWLGNGRDLLKEMSAAKEEYPPQIRALIEQYSSEVIIGKETTLTNVKLSNKRENELAIVEAKLKEFYNKLNGLLYPSGNQEADVPPETEMHEYSNPNFQDLIDGKITKFNDALGDKDTMTNEDWQEYAKLLIYLEKNGRLQYSTETSGRIDKGVLKTDCWGILKIGSLLTLNREGMKGQSFTKIEYMANNFRSGDSLTEIPKGGPLDIEQLTYHPNTFVFIDNDGDKFSYDHVYIVVENLEDKDTGEIYPIGLLGIGGSNIGLQTYDAYEWYQKNSDKLIAYGTQPQKEN